MPPKKKVDPPPETDIELQADELDLPVTGSKAEQHPSVAGDLDAEIEQRTADGPHLPGRFRRTFVIDIGIDDPAVLAAGHTVVMRQEAAQRGLRATDDPVLVNTEVTETRRATTTALTYAMPVVPAALAPDKT